MIQDPDSRGLCVSFKSLYSGPIVQNPKATAGARQAGGGGADTQGAQEIPPRVQAPTRPQARQRRRR